MRTMERLTRAFDRAKILEIDSSSKIIIFSDSHRGDGSLSDEFTKNRHIFVAALQHYYDEGFTLIEAGDNDDLWEWPKFRHIVKANPLTFSLVRQFHVEDRYLRMYGNHDFQLADATYVRENMYSSRSHLTGERRPLLDDLHVHEAIRLRHRVTGQEIFVVHGHQGDFANDQAWKFTMFTFRMLWRHLHMLGIRSPSSPTRNSFKRHKVERNYVRWIVRNGKALICGHTHRERFPSPGDAPYFNSGSCVYPNYITGIEIIDDEIALVTWRVEPDENGYLRVARRTVAGPSPISDFDKPPVTGRARRPGKSLDWSSGRR